MKPKIAIPFDFRSDTGYFLKSDLVECLEGQGAILLPLLYNKERIDEVVREADGLLIPGGVGDVDPYLYGEEKKYECVLVNRPRCDFEYALLEKFLPTKKPLLCICWGLQILNVYLGGSLIQDLDEEFDTHLTHDQEEPVHLATKWVKFVENGEAEKLFGSGKLYINSTHHQGISRLAKNMVVEGHAEDGLIECFRLPDHPFGWAVQWHPERLAGDPVIPVFLKACQRSRS